VRKFNRCVAIVLVVLLIGMTFDVPSFFPYRIQQVYAEKEQIDSGESVAESVYKKLKLMMIYRWTLNHRSHLPIFS